MNENKTANNNLMLGTLAVTSSSVLGGSCIGAMMGNPNSPAGAILIGVSSCFGLAVGLRMISLGAVQKLKLNREKIYSSVREEVPKQKRKVK